MFSKPILGLYRPLLLAKVNVRSLSDLTTGLWCLKSSYYRNLDWSERPTNTPILSGRYLLRKIGVIGFTIFILGISNLSAKAESLRESLEILSRTHKTMIAANADLAAAKEGVATAKGDWYPTLDVTANIGNDKRNKQKGTPDTHQVPRNLEMTLKQKVWDFGSTDSAIRSAKFLRLP